MSDHDALKNPMAIRSEQSMPQTGGMTPNTLSSCGLTCPDA